MKKWVKKVLGAIAIPLLYLLVLRFIFGIEGWYLFEVMSCTFLFLLPVVSGVLTVYFSRDERVRNAWYCIVAPWLPVVVFIVITLMFSIEGWACWIMVFPLFLIGASIGGLIGKSIKNKKNDRTYVSVLVLLPMLISPLEHLIGSRQVTYKAYTSIDIVAPAAAIWKEVTRVTVIQPGQDRGGLTSFLGMPRPVEAVLNYEGVGATREARFTGGLVFHETVLEYIPQQKMVFSIKAHPHEIPSTTMDEHIVIGGKFFDVLTGTYELEQLGSGRYRLHLYSFFKMNTTFNFYAGWWAKWIMKDIQNNILQVEKERAERNETTQTAGLRRKSVT